MNTTPRQPAFQFHILHTALRSAAAAFVCAALAIPMHTALAGPLHERLLERRETHSLPPMPDGLSDEEEAPAEASGARLPPSLRVLSDIAYGDDARQRYDVYLPQKSQAQHLPAPIIVMVHGGGWRAGDKKMRSVVENKAARWVPKGFVFVSVNYRLLPQATPLQQADDVARALAAVQRHAAEYGGDASRVVLMGHSAGAHLVALLSAAPDLAYRSGAQPWLGTVALDSAALDVPGIMRARHLPLYDKAFGSDPQGWKQVSPAHRLEPGAVPLMAVCSSRRQVACPHARRFADQAAAHGIRVKIVEQDLSHLEINDRLGLPGRYTAAVEAFIATLDPNVMQVVARP